MVPILFFICYTIQTEFHEQSHKKIPRRNGYKTSLDVSDSSLYRRKENNGRNSHGRNPPNDRPQGHEKDDEHKRCPGKSCEDDRYSPNEQKKQCSKHSCTSRIDQKVNRECKEKTKNKCLYCVARRCSKSPAKPNEKVKKDDDKSEETKEVSHGKYNRFTPVSRKYPYKGGRSKETRRAPFNKCVLRGIKICRKCRRNTRRMKRQEPRCEQCNTVLGKPPLKGCSHYNRNADFWKRRITESRRQYDIKLSVKDSSDNEAGYLTYKEMEDKKGRPLFFITYVNATSQGTGVGRALMEYFMEKIAIERYHVGQANPKKKTKEVKLQALRGDRNEFAYPLYQRLGFTMDEGHCESDACPSMTLDIRNYKTGDSKWTLPPLDECVWNKRKKGCNIQ